LFHLQDDPKSKPLANFHEIVLKPANEIRFVSSHSDCSSTMILSLGFKAAILLLL